MKNKILLSLLFSVILSSCIDLDTSTTDSIGTADMWTTEELADAGIAGIYDVFYPRNTSEFDCYPQIITGIGRSRIEAISFTSNVYQPPYIQNMSPSAGDTYFSLEWKYCYEGIHLCNDAIANLSKASLPQTKYGRLMAEAKFLRAFFYHRLNMLFQGVPIYLEPINNKDAIKTQSSVEEVWDVVLNDLNDCITEANLPNNTLTQNYGRPSKGAAYALRGMVYLWKKDYKKAITDFEKVSECGYGLWEGKYIDLFKEANEKHKEMILPLQFEGTTNYGDWTQMQFGGRSTLQSFTSLQPNVDFVDSYLNANGSKFKWTDIFPDWDTMPVEQREVFFVRDGMNTKTETAFVNAKKEIISRVTQAVWDKYYLNEGNEARIAKAYETRDPRLQQTIFTPSSTTPCFASTGGKQSDKTVRWPYLVAGNGDAAGDHWPDSRSFYNYTYRKFVVTDNGSMKRNACGRDWPLIRFTDVWLQYAEALNEDGRLDDAINVVNKIRLRAGMPLLTKGAGDINGVSSKEEMLKRIQYERRVELCAEGVNFFDEVRWGTYKETKFQGNATNGFKDMWGRIVRGTWYWNDYLWPWPVPQSEVQRNPNLVPTKGWLY